jgi:hypothetical protein|nr:MAG TPA: stabilization protein [Caudoviricetes sp.]
MGYKVFQNSFLGGIVSPALLSRVDLPDYQQGAMEITNFLINPQGSITTRGGFRYVAPVKEHGHKVRLIPFRFASNQTLVLVFGHFWMRIVTEGKVLLDGDKPFEISTPYSEEDIFNLEYTQNADIITLTNPNHSPKELRRYGATDWRLVDCVFSPKIQPPTEVTATAFYPSGTDARDQDVVTATYVVTSIDADGKESVASATCSTECNYYLTGGSVQVSWLPVEGAQRYRVYRDVSGVFSFLGQTEGTLITDLGDNPDTTCTPPRYDVVFAYANGIKSIDVLDGGSGYSNSDNKDDNVIWINFLPVYYTECKDANPGQVELPQTSFYWTVTFISPTGQQYEGRVENAVQLGNNGGSGGKERGDIACNKYNPKKGFPVSFKGTVPKIDGSWKVKSGWGCEGNMWTCRPTQTSQAFNNANANAHAALSSWESISKYNDMFEGPGISAHMLLNPEGATNEKLDLEITIGTGAKAQATAINGVISFVTILNAGRDYSSSSQVTVKAKRGSGAKFKVNIFGKDDYDYPSANTQYDQRRVFAGTYNNPVRILMTNAGQQDLMMHHLPTMADDRISLEAVTSDADRIIHAVALDSLLLFSRSAELRVFTQNSDSLSPDSVAVRVQSYVGANQVQPIICNANVLYAASRGGHLRALNYTYSAQGYESADLSLICPQLFDNKEIVDLALSKSPIQLAWVVSSDGKLNVLTYYPEQSIKAWSVFETDGKFESCCVVAEGIEDHLYVVVKREVNGKEVRYIERLEYINIPNNDDCRQLDSFIDNTNVLVSENKSDEMTLTGLEHLEGKMVVAFADGVPHKPEQVVNGSIKIAQNGAKKIAVGIPYKSRLVTVPLATTEAQASMQGSIKNPSAIFLRTRFDGDVFAGSYNSENSESELWKIDREDVSNKKGLLKVAISSSWEFNGQLEIVHKNALPLEITGIVGEYSYEGYKK